MLRAPVFKNFMVQGTVEVPDKVSEELPENNYSSDRLHCSTHTLQKCDNGKLVSVGLGVSA